MGTSLTMFIFNAHITGLLSDKKQTFFIKKETQDAPIGSTYNNI